MADLKQQLDFNIRSTALNLSISSAGEGVGTTEITRRATAFKDFLEGQDTAAKVPEATVTTEVTVTPGLTTVTHDQITAFFKENAEYLRERSYSDRDNYAVYNEWSLERGEKPFSFEVFRGRLNAIRTTEA